MSWDEEVFQTMYINVYYFVQGYSYREEAEQKAEDCIIHKLVSENVVDYTGKTAAFELDSSDAQRVMDDYEDYHIYGVEWSKGEPQFPDPDNSDAPGTPYMVAANCHVKPGDDLFPKPAEHSDRQEREA